MHRSSDDGMGEDHSISHVTNHKKHKFISIQSTKGVKFFQRTKIVQKTKIIERQPQAKNSLVIQPCLFPNMEIQNYDVFLQVRPQNHVICIIWNISCLI